MRDFRCVRSTAGATHDFPQSWQQQRCRHTANRPIPAVRHTRHQAPEPQRCPWLRATGHIGTLILAEVARTAMPNTTRTACFRRRPKPSVGPKAVANSLGVIRSVIRSSLVRVQISRKEMSQMLRCRKSLFHVRTNAIPRHWRTARKIRTAPKPVHAQFGWTGQPQQTPASKGLV